MNASEDKKSQLSRVSRALIELVVIFVGVTAAFVVDGYRVRLDEKQQLRRATDGILTELYRYKVKAVEHADSIDVRIGRWAAADSAGHRATPGFYRIPGAPTPPTAAWDAAVSSGVASMFDADLRLALGYFYSELLGIHNNYIRRLEFIENVVLPLTEQGADAFYDASGNLKPEIKVQMMLLAEFSADLRWASRSAAELENWLRFGKRADIAN